MCYLICFPFSLPGSPRVFHAGLEKPAGERSSPHCPNEAGVKEREREFKNGVWNQNQEARAEAKARTKRAKAINADPIGPVS